MSDAHRRRIEDRLDLFDDAKMLYERMVEADVPAHDTRGVISQLKKASRKIDGNGFDMYVDEALARIAAQCRASGHDDLADDAREILDGRGD